MSEEVEGLFSKISFVVDDTGFKKLEDYLFLASSTFSELNVKTEEFEENLRRIAKSTRELSKLKYPKIPDVPTPRQRSQRAPYSPEIGELGRASTRFSQRGGQRLNFAGVKGFEGFGGMASKITPLAGSLGLVGLALTGVGIALKKVIMGFSRYAQQQAKVINQSQILATSLGLQQSQILGLADAYKTLGLDSGDFLASVKGVQGAQAGLAMGKSPEQQLIALAVGGVRGGAGALLSGDTDKLIQLVGEQVNRLEAMGETGKRQLAVLNANFPELVKEAQKRQISVAQIGRTPEQLARELTKTRFEDVAGGTAEVAKKSAQFNLALQRLKATFENFKNIMISQSLPAFTSFIEGINNVITKIKKVTLEFGLFISKLDNIKTLFLDIFDSVSTSLKSILEKIKHPMEAAYQEEVQPLISSFSSFMDKISNALAAPQLAYATSSLPPARRPDSGNTNNTQNQTNNVNINVHAQNSNPQEVAEMIRNEFKKEIEHASQSNQPIGN